MKKKTIKKVLVDGKVDSPRKKDLYDILGGNKNNPYGKVNLEQYRKEIEAMDTSDLHTHAISVGLIPIDNRRILLSRLEKEFARHQIRMTPSQSTPALEGKRAERFMQIMHGKRGSK